MQIGDIIYRLTAANLLHHIRQSRLASIIRQITHCVREHIDTIHLCGQIVHHLFAQYPLLGFQQRELFVGLDISSADNATLMIGVLSVLIVQQLPTHAIYVPNTITAAHRSNAILCQLCAKLKIAPVQIELAGSIFISVLLAVCIHFFDDRMDHIFAAGAIVVGSIPNLEICSAGLRGLDVSSDTSQSRHVTSIPLCSSQAVIPSIRNITVQHITILRVPTDQLAIQRTYFCPSPIILCKVSTVMNPLWAYSSAASWSVS